MSTGIHGLIAFMTGLAIFVTGGPILAQSYPTKPIRILVPFPPGGTADILARVIGQKLGARWTESVIVDNRPGAGATIGTTVIAKAAPDGYSLLMTGNSHAVAKSLYSELSYDPFKDFAPILLVGASPNVLVVNPSLPVRTVAELIALAKSKPNQLTFASAGPGSGSHLAGQLFKTLAGIEMVHVPYKGISPGILDVVAGRVSLAFAVLSGVYPQIRAGKLRALAVTSAKRSAFFPELPAVQESGLKGIDVVSWFGIFAPTGTPAAIVSTLNKEINKALQMKDIKEQLTELGVEIKGGSPEEFGKFVESDWAMWDKVIKDSGIRIE